MKPKLLVFSHICSPHYITGAEKLLLFMVRELLQSYACTLVVPTEGVIAAQARKLGIPVAVQDVPLVVSLYSAVPTFEEDIARLQQGPEWRELFLLLARERPNGILVNTCVHPLPAIAAKLLGIPVIWSAMEQIRTTADQAAAAAVIERYSDYVLGISEATLKPLRTPGLLPRTTMIPPSWHPGELQPENWRNNRALKRAELGFAEEHRVLGYISSSIFESKGLEHFVLMAVKLSMQHPKARFLVIGNPIDEPYFARCKTLVQATGLAERFRWIQFEEQVANAYPAMDILVVPSLAAEGFGMTAMEGMVFGKAVIVYGSGGLAEIGRATGNADYVVPTGDIDGLAVRASLLLGDENLLASVSSRNVGEVNAAYGISAYRERLRKFVAGVKLRTPYTPIACKGGGPNVYLFDNGMIRPFRHPEALADAGYRMEDVRAVEDAFLALWPVGDPIGAQTAAVRKGGKKRSRRSIDRRRVVSGRRAGKRRRVIRRSGSVRSRKASRVRKKRSR